MLVTSAACPPRFSTPPGRDQRAAERSSHTKLLFLAVQHPIAFIRAEHMNIIFYWAESCLARSDGKEI